MFSNILFTLFSSYAMIFIIHLSLISWVCLGYNAKQEHEFYSLSRSLKHNFSSYTKCKIKQDSRFIRIIHIVIILYFFTQDASSIVSLVCGTNKIAWAHVDRGMTVLDWQQLDCPNFLKGTYMASSYLSDVSICI